MFNRIYVNKSNYWIVFENCMTVVGLVENWEQVFPPPSTWRLSQQKDFNSMQFSKTLSFLQIQYYKNKSKDRDSHVIQRCWHERHVEMKIKQYLMSMLTDLSGILDKLMPLGLKLATWVDMSGPRLVSRAQHGHPLRVFWRDKLHCVGGASDVYSRVILNLTGRNTESIPPNDT